MTSKLTRERAQQIFLGNGPEPSASEERELARMALAAMGSEPVIIVGDDGGDALSYRRLIQSFEPGTKLYLHAQPASEREQVRQEHAEWSQSTFGNVGPVGPLKHLSKEALETAVDPDDLSEWADMQFLLWDAQRRSGITDEQITQAMIDKLAVNKQRKWPEPKDGEPRLHIKEQPAPVVPVIPDFKKLARELVDNLVDCGGLDEGVKEKYLEWAEKTCHAAMFAAAPHLPGSEPATVPGTWIPVNERLPEAGGDMIVFTDGIVMSGVSYAKKKGFYIQALEYDDDEPVDSVTHWMPLPAAPQEVKDAHH